MPTIQQQINQLKKDKENLNTMLNTMGVETTGNETFTQLTPLVGKIVTDPILQDKSITITKNGTQTITADEGYDGLNNVSVTTNIASSGGGGETPAVGFVVNEWDSQGYPLDVTFVGRTTIGAYMFSCYKQNYGVCGKMTKIQLPNDVTAINNYAFYNCVNLTDINFPDTITTIGQSAFNSCILLPQVSLKNVQKINSNGFDNCMGMKAIWIGSSITSIGTQAFRYCSALTKIFIDLPRATVEAMANYSSAFGRGSGYTSLIVCNDDEGFITKEEFDATTW